VRLCRLALRPGSATLGEIFQNHGLELLGPPIAKRKAA
jgi:hypothetical protein